MCLEYNCEIFLYLFINIVVNLLGFCKLCISGRCYIFKYFQTFIKYSFNIILPVFLLCVQLYESISLLHFLYRPMAVFVMYSLW